MFRKAQILFLMILFMMLFLVSCGNTEKTESSDESSSIVEEQVETSDQLENEVIDPTVVTLENSNAGVVIRWQEVSEAEGYYVYHKKEGEKYSVIAKITDPTIIEYVDTEALSGASYYYAVRAFVGEQKSDYEAVNITTGIWEPEIKVVYEEPKMNVTWNEIPGCNGYIVYRKAEGEKYSVLSKIKDSAVTSYVDDEILVGEVYTYAVRAFMGEEKSTFTAVTKATIGQPVVEVRDVDAGVEVSWNEIKGAEGYIVYRKEKGGKYEVLQTIEDKKTTSYVDSDYSVGTTYIYAVRSYLGKYKSSFLAVDITADLGRVTVALDTTASGIKVSWNEISVAEGYYIYRKAEGEEEYTLINTIDDASISSYVDQQVESDKTYYYNVRAFLGDEQSSYSGAKISSKVK